MASHDDAELHELGEAAVADIDAWEQQITQLKHDWPEQEAIQWVSSLVSDR